MKQNKRIAITGGIGSGKSTVAKIIGEQGWPVFSCDEVYAKLLQNADFLQELSVRFGDVLTEDGKLDKAKLSAIVFRDENKREELNNFTHPKVFEEMFKEAQEFDSTCFFEVPLLFECGYESKFDQVIVVQRGLQDRIESVVKRSNLTFEQVVERIKAQYNYDKCDFAEYYVIHNIKDFAFLKEESLRVLKEITN